MKKVILLTIMTVLCLGAGAEDFKYKGPDGNTLYYNILTPTTVEVTYKDIIKNYKYTEVIIPNQVFYKGQLYAVTSISEYAFARCYSLKSITMPNSITSIETEAFQDCSSLASITIPNSVTTIGKSAFSYCKSLTSVTIPNSVAKIMAYMFHKCI